MSSVKKFRAVDSADREMKKPANLLLLVTASLFGLSSLFVTKAAAQQPKPNIFPRVGVIGELDEAVRSAWGGCDKHYLSPLNGSIGKYIFVSNADGSIAWMNLNGQDVRLELVKTTLWRRRRGNVFAQYEYRARRIQITVGLPQETDYIFGYRAKIVLRKGPGIRTINVFGLPQCD